MKLKMIPIALLAVTAAAFAVAQETTLKWSPKEGATHKYRFTVSANIEGAGEMEMTSVSTRKILSVKDGKIIVEEKQADSKMMIGGQDMSSMIPEAPVVTYTFNEDGEILDRKLSTPTDMDTARIEAVGMFTYPKKAVKMNDTWTRTVKANKEKGTYGIEATFTYLGTEMVNGKPTHKVAVDSKEVDAPQNMAVKGTMWLDPDGELVKLEQNASNVQLADAMPPMDMKITLNRIS